jgi:DNA-dependent RNA polymerase
MEPNVDIMYKSFTFLERERFLMNLIFDTALALEIRDSQKNEIVNRSNYINYGSRKIYLSDYSWNAIYGVLLKSITLKDGDSTMDDAVGNFDIHNKVVSRQDFYVRIENVLKEIHSGEITHVYLNLFKIIFKDVKHSEEFLSLYTQSYFMTALKRHHGDVDNLEMPVTATSSKFGSMICKYFFSQNKSFTRLLNTLSSKDIKPVSRADIHKLIQYVKVLLTGDEKEQHQFYLEWSSVVENKLIILTKTYVLSIAYERYNRNDIPYPELYKLLDKYSTNYNHVTLYNDLNNLYIQLGHLLIRLYESVNILERFTKFITKVKSQLMVKVNKEILESMIDSFSLNRPYMVASNVTWLKTMQDEDMVYKVSYEGKSNFIHTNLDINIEIKDNSYLFNNKPLNKYKVDSNYLHYFMDFVSKANVFGSSPETFDIILSLYDIDYMKLRSLLENDTVKDLLDRCVLFALNLNISSDKGLQKEIENCNDKQKSILTEIWNKINSYKIYLKGLIKDAYLYSIFNYFLVDHFIDTRGRFYNNTIFVNVQSFPNAKMFIKYYVSEESQNNFKDHYTYIQSAVSKALLFKEQQEYISNMDYNTYVQNNNKLRYNYIHDFFDSNLISNEEFNKLYNHDNLTDIKTIARIKHTLKKSKRLFIVHSMLLLERYPQDNIQNYYEIDATCSGLQMVSLLVKSPELASLCNLIGNEKNDIYLLAVDKFKEQRILLDNLLRDFTVYTHKDILKDIDKNETFNVNKESFSNLSNFNQRILAFLNMDSKNSSYAIDLINSLDKDLVDNKIPIPDIKGLLWLLSKTDMKQSNLPTLKIPLTHYQYLMLLKKAFKFNVTLLGQTWIQDNNVFLNRDLFKKSIMTYFYNATNFGRKEDIIAFLWDQGKHLNKDLNNSKAFTYIATIIELYFSYFMLTYVHDSTLMNKVSNLLTLQKKPIIINNKYFEITFAPKKTIKSILQTSAFNRKRESQLTIHKYTDEIDSTLIKRRFNPNFIHSMDATIVHNFITRITNINIKLLNLFEINYHVNHDTFGSYSTPFLKTIIEDSYRELYSSNYFNYLENLDPAILAQLKDLVHKTDLDLTIFNKYFIK